MRTLWVAELEKARRYIELAAECATKSNCKKYKRGAVLVVSDRILGEGSDTANKKTLDNECIDCDRLGVHNSAIAKLCSATHAEVMAMEAAKAKEEVLKGSILYVADVHNNGVKPPKLGCPSCLESLSEEGVEVVLFDGRDYKIYSPSEYSKQST